MPIARYTLAALLAALLALGATSCKTNQKNMSDAYYKAIAGAKADEADDIYKQVRREMQHSTMTIGADSVDISTQWVRITDGGGGVKENIRRYCVVVGQFKQLFNARSMRERLVENGYPACFVVETREPYYFVVAGSFDDIAPALELMRRAETDAIFRFKAPLPFILRPSQIR